MVRARAEHMLVGCALLALLTLGSLSARGQNTAAVLQEYNRRERGGKGGFKLFYNGPLYSGSGQWKAGTKDNWLEDVDKIQQLSAGIDVHTHHHAHIHEHTNSDSYSSRVWKGFGAHDSSLGSMHTKGANMAAAVKGGRAAAIAAAHAAGLEVHSRAYHRQRVAAQQWLTKEPDVVKEGMKKAGNVGGKFLQMIGRAAAPVERALGRLAVNGKELGGEISDGFEKTWDVHDVRVRPKQPVKMLTHV